MYAPHTVTLYNVYENPSTLAISYNVTILRGVFLELGKADRIQKNGLADGDSATLYIPFNVTALSSNGIPKTYKTPKEYAALQDKSGSWTIETGGASSGVDCFFIKGETVSQLGYKVLRSTYDYVYDVSDVSIRDFGSRDMQHWQVSGK